MYYGVLLLADSNGGVDAEKVGDKRVAVCGRDFDWHRAFQDAAVGKFDGYSASRHSGRCEVAGCLAYFFDFHDRKPMGHKELVDNEGFAVDFVPAA